MQKRAQLSVFIIIGIVIIAAIGFLVMLKQPKTEEIPPSMAHIKIFVEQCVKQTAENAILLTGVQGGYIYFDDIDSFETFYSETAYWYQLGYDFSPKKEVVEQQINRYIIEEINTRCLQDFKVLHENITSGEMEVKTTIMLETVIVDVDFPVTLNDKSISTTISKFSVDFKVKLGMALDVGKKIVGMEMSDPSTIDFNYLAGLPLPIIITQDEDEIILYSIVDRESDIAGFPFRLIFANNIAKDVSTPNKYPKIYPIDDITVKAGETLRLQVNATDDDEDNLTFSSITNIFTMTEDGWMILAPTAEDVGEHFAMVEVVDGKGGFDTEQVKITVK